MIRKYALADKKTRVVKKIIEQDITLPPPHSEKIEAIIVQEQWGLEVGDRFGDRSKGEPVVVKKKGLLASLKFW